MANQQQLGLLWRGKDVWNTWRNQHSATLIDLSGADLSDANLRGANLSRANLRDAILSGADLCGAKL